MPTTDEKDNALPVKLPPAAPLKFGLNQVDYAVNKSLEGLIPSKAKTAKVSVMITSDGVSRVLQGVAAARTGPMGDWRLDLGGAVAGAVDLDDHSKYKFEFLGVVSWE